jgi:hypothetical protein
VLQVTLVAELKECIESKAPTRHACRGKQIRGWSMTQSPGINNRHAPDSVAVAPLSPSDLSRASQSSRLRDFDCPGTGLNRSLREACVWAPP